MYILRMGGKGIWPLGSPAQPPVTHQRAYFVRQLGRDIFVFGLQRPLSEKRPFFLLFFFLNHCFSLSSSNRGEVLSTLSDLLDKPWSHVSSLLGPRYIHASFFESIGFSVPTFKLFAIDCRFSFSFCC